MTRLFIVVAFLLLVWLAPSNAAEEVWTSDYAAAAAKAKKENKALLLDFTGSDWCCWCMKLKEEVFAQKEFKDWAAQKAVLIEVDFPRHNMLAAETTKQNAELRNKYNIRGYPTIIVLGPTENKIGELGYMNGGPAAWTKACDEILAKGK
jgi:thioredoxin-related protein